MEGGCWERKKQRRRSIPVSAQRSGEGKSRDTTRSTPLCTHPHIEGARIASWKKQQMAGLINFVGEGRISLKS